MQEVKEQREENIRVIKEEIRYWGEEIERLERLLEVSEAEWSGMVQRERNNEADDL
jgi:hypothetical protein